MPPIDSQGMGTGWHRSERKMYVSKSFGPERDDARTERFDNARRKGEGGRKGRDRETETETEVGGLECVLEF